MSHHHVAFLDCTVHARELRVGDEVMTEDYAGKIDMIDTLDLSAVPIVKWELLHISIAGPGFGGYIARFPHETVLVTRGVRECTDPECEDRDAPEVLLP